MDIEEIVGIVDPDSPLDRRARRLVEHDDKLLDDLIQLRRTKGMTQSDVAEIMGVSQSAIARIESGDRDPHLSTLRRYAISVGAMVFHRVADDEATGADLKAQLNVLLERLDKLRVVTGRNVSAHNEHYVPFSDANLASRFWPTHNKVRRDEYA